MHIYTYIPDLVNISYLQMGPWEGGPIQDLGFHSGRMYLRFPSAEAVASAMPEESMDFREATNEEIEALGTLPEYPA